MKVATAVGLAGLVAVAGCSATQDSNQTLHTGNAADAIFQQHMADVSGSGIGLVGTKMIALTFDDGPQRGTTDELLDFLKEQDVQATFFMVGRHVIGNEDLVQRMRDQGMSLGNHTFDHTPIVKMSRTIGMNAVYQEIAKDDSLISPYLLPNKHIFFRSPGGSWTQAIAQAMNSHADISQKYIGPVFWDIGGSTYFADDKGSPMQGEIKSFDQGSNTVTYVKRDANQRIIKTWTEESPSLYAAADWDCGLLKIPTTMCFEGYMNEIHRRGGGIVLMHDTHPESIEMAKMLIPALKAEGYQFITLDEIPNIQKFE